MFFLGSALEHIALWPLNHFLLTRYVLDYATDVSDNNDGIVAGSYSHRTHQSPSDSENRRYPPYLIPIFQMHLSRNLPFAIASRSSAPNLLRVAVPRVLILYYHAQAYVRYVDQSSKRIGKVHKQKYRHKSYQNASPVLLKHPDALFR
ncbi:hypothetical protein D3C87_1305500 [compost metagenome]